MRWTSTDSPSAPRGNCSRSDPRVGLALRVGGRCTRGRTASPSAAPGSGSDGRLSRSMPAAASGSSTVGARPEIRREERDRAFEVSGVQEQRPALVAGRDVLAGGGRLGCGERQRQVAVAEQLAARALFQVQPVRRPEHPRAELRDRVLPLGLLPVAALARRRGRWPTR